MNEQAKSFFQNLEEIVTDPIFIGSSPADLQQETRTNMWLISASDEERQRLSVGELADFLGRVVENRRRQITGAQANHGMFFYLWHDAQAGQLRFNLISDFHAKLPFGSKINPVSTPDHILNEFLNQSPLIPAVEGTDLEEPAPAEYILDVYVARLP